MRSIVVDQYFDFHVGGINQLSFDALKFLRLFTVPLPCYTVMPPC